MKFYVNVGLDANSDAVLAGMPEVAGDTYRIKRALRSLSSLVYKFLTRNFVVACIARPNFEEITKYN